MTTTTDIRAFFKNASSDRENEVEEPKRKAEAPAVLLEEPTTQKATAKRQCHAKTKLLVVKSEAETARFVLRQEYEPLIKYVVATHRSIRVAACDTRTITVKQRGQIDAEIGHYDELLGCDELLALVETAQVIAKILLEESGQKLVVVVVAYRNKGAHGAYLLAKLAQRLIAEKDRKLGDATRVREPKKWQYCDLWDILRNVQPTSSTLLYAIENYYTRPRDKTLCSSP